MTKPYQAQGGKPIFNEVVTPIGLIVHLYHDKPQLKTKDQYGNIPDIDPKTGIQNAEYKATIAWSKTRMADLQPLIDLAHKTKAEAWPESQQPGAFFALEPFFRDGDNPAHNTKGREYLRGRYYLNFKAKANAVKDASGQVIYSGAPGIAGPNGAGHVIFPTDIYPGCTGRVFGIMFGTEYMGKHFISTRLNVIQLYQEGERIGGTARPTADQLLGQMPGGGSLVGGVPGVSQAPLGNLGMPTVTAPGVVQPQTSYAQQPALPVTGAFPSNIVI